MDNQSLIIIAIVIAVVAIAGFFVFRIFVGGQKAADNEVGRHQRDIDDQRQVNRIKKEERERDERARAADPRNNPGDPDPRDGRADPNSPIRDVHRDNRHNSPMRDTVLNTDRDVLRDQPEDGGPDRRI